MVEKISAEEMRKMGIKDLQRLITDHRKKKSDVFAESMGTKNPSQPSEDIGTIKRNIARAKTIINEQMEASQ